MQERQQVDIQGKVYQLIWADVLASCSEVHLELDKIFIRRSLPEDRAMATLLHEAIEVINDELKLRLGHDTIDRLEPGLFGFLKKSGVDMKPLIYEPGGDGDV